MRSLTRAASVATAVVALTAATATPALAADTRDWKKPFDTDTVAGSSPSGKAYVTGSFAWADEDSRSANHDQKASFKVALKVNGPAGSCARLRIRTYVGERWRNNGLHLEEQFPLKPVASDYQHYSYCPSSGKGTLYLSGYDIQDRSIGDIGAFKRATFNVCYTRSRSVPPGGDCYDWYVLAGGN